MPPVAVLLHSSKTPPAWKKFVGKFENFFIEMKLKSLNLRCVGLQWQPVRIESCSGTCHSKWY